MPQSETPDPKLSTDAAKWRAVEPLLRAAIEAEEAADKVEYASRSVWDAALASSAAQWERALAVIRSTIQGSPAANLEYPVEREYTAKQISKNTGKEPA